MEQPVSSSARIRSWVAAGPHLSEIRFGLLSQWGHRLHVHGFNHCHFLLLGHGEFFRLILSLPFSLRGASRLPGGFWQRGPLYGAE